MIRNKKEFIQFFETEIRPKYEESISQGKEAIKKWMKFGMIFVIGFFVLSIFLGPLLFLIFPVIFITLFIYHKKGKELPIPIHLLSSENKYMNPVELIKLKDEIFNDIIQNVLPGFRYSYKFSLKPEEFEKYGLISSSKIDNFRSEDTIVGKLNNRPIRISELHISKKVERNDSTEYVLVFRGFITELKTNVDPNFSLIVSKKEYHSKTISFMDKSDLEEITLSNVFIDDNYIVKTNNAVLANKILQPRNIERFININKNIADISIGVHNGKLTLLTENERNIFNIFKGNAFDEPEIIWEDIVHTTKTIQYVKQLDIDIEEIN